MMLVRTQAGPSAIHGVGLFAAEPIAAGTVIWRFVPEMDRVVPEEAIAAMPAAVREFFDRYAFPTPFFPGGLMVSLDNTRFINHSDQPNTDNSGPETTALRDIAEGEEITCDYGELLPAYELLP